MPFDRREFLAASIAAATAACAQRAAEVADEPVSTAAGIPGPYPGKVVAVHHPASFINTQFQREPIEQMVSRGITALTGADDATEAWRSFFEPGDVVGIKLNPVGKPAVISSPETVQSIIAGLESAGIPRRDIVAYDRYGDQFQQAGFDKWLPEGVRWMAASDKSYRIQLDMDGYDRDTYMEMPLVHPVSAEEYRLDDPHVRRSYVAKWVTHECNKIINLCLLKHHQSAGVTLALKNISHGMVNNVSRSHASTTANACGIFIPAVVELPIIRQKIVLNILDGVKAAYHGGPGETVRHYAWGHKTMYFATDPVAMDKVGWKEIDKKRAEVDRAPIALMKPDDHSRWLNGQVEHIELAGNYGLGVFDDEKINQLHIDLG